MSKDSLLSFKRHGNLAAVALPFRNLEGLQADVMMECEVGA
jgi:hypothetical protein